MDLHAPADRGVANQALDRLLRPGLGRRNESPEWLRRLRTAMFIVDAAIIAVSGYSARAIRFGDVDAMVAGSSAPWLSYHSLAALVGLTWLVMLVFAGAYDRRVIGTGSDEYRRVLQASLVVVGLVGLASFLASLEVSRGWVLLAFPLGTAGLLGGRWAVRQALHRQRRRRQAMHQTLLVGDRTRVGSVAATLRRETHAGFDVVGVCLPQAGEEEELEDLAVLGELDQVRAVVEAYDIDTVAVAGSETLTPGRLRRLAWDLEGLGVDLVVSPSLVDVAGPRIHVRPLSGLPLIHVDTPAFTGLRRVGKVLLDVMGSCVLLLLAMPAFVVAAIVIKLDDGGSVMYRQIRVGRGGKPFRMLKFRSMREDAEQQRESLAELNEADGPLFKIRNDPRLTRVGRFMRRWSLDELPQLFNVLKGEMSLVGPRPPLPEEVAAFGDDASRRLLVRPGITGVWQVSGRSEVSWPDSVRMDLWYVENWSLAQDFLILFKTIRAVLSRRGAY